MSEVRAELGFSDEDYEELLEASHDRCWICGDIEQIEGRRLAVDHDHTTGAIRGLLCTKCNRRLGAARNYRWFERAAEYLRAAARAFGDGCPRCSLNSTTPQPSRLDWSNGITTRYVFRCTNCDHVWTCEFRTHGEPDSWVSWGRVPIPPVRSVENACDEGTGHPGGHGGPACHWAIDSTSYRWVNRGTHLALAVIEHEREREMFHVRQDGRGWFAAFCATFDGCVVSLPKAADQIGAALQALGHAINIGVIRPDAKEVPS